MGMALLALRQGQAAQPAAAVADDENLWGLCGWRGCILVCLGAGPVGQTVDTDLHEHVRHAYGEKEVVLLKPKSGEAL